MAAAALLVSKKNLVHFVNVCIFVGNVVQTARARPAHQDHRSSWSHSRSVKEEVVECCRDLRHDFLCDARVDIVSKAALSRQLFFITVLSQSTANKILMTVCLLCASTCFHSAILLICYALEVVPLTQFARLLSG